MGSEFKIDWITIVHQMDMIAGEMISLDSRIDHLLGHTANKIEEVTEDEQNIELELYNRLGTNSRTTEENTLPHCIYSS